MFSKYKLASFRDHFQTSRMSITVFNHFRTKCKITVQYASSITHLLLYFAQIEGFYANFS